MVLSSQRMVRSSTRNHDPWELEAQQTKAVLEFLLEKGYHRYDENHQEEQKSKRIDPTEKSVGQMFQWPFYFGMLEQTQQTTDLRSIN